MKLLFNYILFIFLFFTSFTISQTNKSNQILEFLNPPKKFMPMPFWHMNGDLQDKEILRQMQDAKKMNFSGIAILPMHNMTPEFLSDTYFEKYKLILETAKKMDMNIILYDDIGFPSGTAGGKIERDYPQHVRKSLEKIEHKIIRGVVFKSFVPEGQLMAAVGMNMETKERIDLTPFIKNKLLTWHFPRTKNRNWTVQFYMNRPATFWKSYMPIDAMDPEAINQFVKLTYDEYAKRFSSYFKNTIQLTFFDDVGFLRRERTWTGKFNEKFEEINGFSPVLYYPALWYDIGPETEAARVAFFNTRSELLAEGYPKQVKEWTKKYGLKNTGHPPGNYAIQPVDMHGDIFKFFRYTDLPLADAIIDYGHGIDGFKLISSAADYYDRPIVSTEVFGAFKEKIVDENMLYRTAMELFVRGVNFTVPHGMWYNPEKIGIPPLISAESEKLAGVLPSFSTYVGRSCYLLQGGRKVSEIAILYPIESLQAGYYFDAPENKVSAGKWAYEEADYQKVGSILTNEIRQDFTFVHPEFLITDTYSIENESIKLNNKVNHQDYKVMIIPGGKVISVKALQKIKQFYDEGGKVIATTLLPTKSSEIGKDAQVVKLISDLFGKDGVTRGQIQTNKKGGKSLFLANPSKENLQKTIDNFHPTPSIIFGNNPTITSELGLFSYMHKVKKEKNIYYFANSSDQEISTIVYVRGEIKLEDWNPKNGNASVLQKGNYKKVNGETYTRHKLTLAPVSSTFWVEK